jgi:hypothetical protein
LDDLERFVTMLSLALSSDKIAHAQLLQRCYCSPSLDHRLPPPCTLPIPIPLQISMSEHAQLQNNCVRLKSLNVAKEGKEMTKYEAFTLREWTQLIGFVEALGGIATPWRFVTQRRTGCSGRCCFRVQRSVRGGESAARRRIVTAWRVPGNGCVY